MTPNDVLVLAIGAAAVILIIAGILRGATRRRGANEDAFGAGGVSEVAIGTVGVAKTPLDPDGVVLAAGEQWTARSANGVSIEEGQGIRVIGQKGLILLVEPAPDRPTTSVSARPPQTPMSTP